MDSETGLLYLRARWMDMGTGRFLSEDPIRDGNNWYIYCGSNPVNFIDPFGLEYIVVSGSEENVIWNRRYKYNFIETAIKKLRELKGLNDGENITWLISSFDYSKKDIQNFKDTAEDIGVNIEFFANKNEFIGYINTKGVWGDSSARNGDKIKKNGCFCTRCGWSIRFWCI